MSRKQDGFGEGGAGDLERENAELKSKLDAYKGYLLFAILFLVGVLGTAFGVF